MSAVMKMMKNVADTSLFQEILEKRQQSMQDLPKLLPDMYSILKEGYDCVATKRATRTGEPKLRSFFSDCFYKLINRLSDTEIVSGVCFCLFSFLIIAVIIVRTLIWGDPVAVL